MKRFWLLLCTLLMLAGTACAQSFGEEGTGVYPFAGDIPKVLLSALSGSEWEGYEVVSGSYATRFHENRYAQVIFEKDGRYVLCLFTYLDGNWKLDVQTERALYQDRAATIVPEQDYEESFSIVYEDGNMSESFFVFLGGRGWQFNRYIRTVNGQEEIDIQADARTLRANGTTLFNPFPLRMDAFDIQTFPHTLDEAIAASDRSPEMQRNTGITRPFSESQMYPSVPLFDAPSAQAKQIMHYYRAVEADVLGEQNGFVQIRIGNVTGYMKREDIALGVEKADLHPYHGHPGMTRAQFPNRDVVLREHAESDSNMIGQIETGKYVTVIGITPDEQWLHVFDGAKSSGYEDDYNPDADDVTYGFMAISQVTQTDNLRSALIANPNPSDRLHLRATPSKNGESLGKYYNGLEVEFLFGSENESAWRYVTIEGVVGYVNSGYLNYASDARMTHLVPLATVQGTNGGLTLRETPSTNAASIAVYDNGAVVEVMAVLDRWAHVRTQEGLCGFMQLKHLGGEPSASVPAVTTVARETPLYHWPEETRESDQSLQPGDVVGINMRPAIAWTRPYSSGENGEENIAVEGMPEWAFVTVGETSGFVKWNDLASPWER